MPDETSNTSETADSTCESSDQHSLDSSASDSGIGSETTQSTEYSSSGCNGTSSDSWTSDSSDEDEECHNVGDQSNYLTSSLCDGASIRVLDSYLLLFQLNLRHSLSGIGFEELVSVHPEHIKLHWTLYPYT